MWASWPPSASAFCKMHRPRTAGVCPKKWPSTWHPIAPFMWVLLLRTSAALVFLSCLHSHSHDLVTSFVRTCAGSILYILEGICIKTNSSYTNNLLLYNSFPLTKACSVVIPSGSHNSLMSETGVFSIPPTGNLWNNWFKVNRDYNPGHLRSDLVLFLL